MELIISILLKKLFIIYYLLFIIFDSMQLYIIFRNILKVVNNIDIIKFCRKFTL